MGTMNILRIFRKSGNDRIVRSVFMFLDIRWLGCQKGKIRGPILNLEP